MVWVELWDSVLVQAGDAYAFGMICWEMVAGKRATSSTGPELLLQAATSSGAKLKFPEDTYIPLARLINSCLARDPAKRPPFRELVPALKDQLTHFASEHGLTASA